MRIGLGLVNEEKNKNWPLEKISGLPKLVSFVEKILMTTYGSDEENPNVGCYIKRMIGRNYNSINNIAAKLDREIKRVERQIISIQTNLDFSIPEEEQLKELRLKDIYQDSEQEIWGINAHYIVVNKKGESYEGILLSKENQERI